MCCNLRYGDLAKKNEAVGSNRQPRFLTASLLYVYFNLLVFYPMSHGFAVATVIDIDPFPFDGATGIFRHIHDIAYLYLRA